MNGMHLKQQQIKFSTRLSIKYLLKKIFKARFLRTGFVFLLFIYLYATGLIRDSGLPIQYCNQNLFLQDA
jgi:hypothetical protein